MTENVVVHPLVLLSILDHYTRVDNPRVAGLILGTESGDLHITNSFAVPFDEGDEDGVWFFDTSFQQNMFDLFKKIHSHERVLGWYHSGANLHKNDYEITSSLLLTVSDPILLIVDIHSEKNDFPIKVFRIQGTDFVHVNTCIEAEEAEEVGVEHLIRDIKSDSHEKKNIVKESLIIYEKNLEVIENYLQSIIAGNTEKNFKVLAHLQKCLNDTPHLVAGHDENSVELYSANLVRSVVAMVDLDKNKNTNKVH